MRALALDRRASLPRRRRKLSLRLDRRRALAGLQVEHRPDTRQRSANMMAPPCGIPGVFESSPYCERPAHSSSTWKRVPVNRGTGQRGASRASRRPSSCRPLERSMPQTKAPVPRVPAEPVRWSRAAADAGGADAQEATAATARRSAGAAPHRGPPAGPRRGSGVRDQPGRGRGTMISYRSDVAQGARPVPLKRVAHGHASTPTRSPRRCGCSRGAVSAPLRDGRIDPSIRRSSPGTCCSDRPFRRSVLFSGVTRSSTPRDACCGRQNCTEDLGPPTRGYARCSRLGRGRVTSPGRRTLLVAVPVERHWRHEGGAVVGVFVPVPSRMPPGPRVATCSSSSSTTSNSRSHPSPAVAGTASPRCSPGCRRCSSIRRDQRR